MSKPTSRRLSPCILRWLGLSAFVGLFGIVSPAQAVTDVSQTPLLTASGTPVKPNLLFILDDSGSMDNTYLPEDAGFALSKYGRQAAQCNGLAYSPTTTYATPLDSTGVSTAAADKSFLNTAAVGTNGTTTPRTISTASVTLADTGSIKVRVTGNSFRTSTYAAGNVVTVYSNGTTTKFMTAAITGWTRIDASTGDLTISPFYTTSTSSVTDPVVADGMPTLNVYYTYSGAQSKLSYSYDNAGNVVTSSNFYKECNANLRASPGASVFTPVYVSYSSAEAQNYANWSVNYSTRLKMMKTVVSQAFKDIDDRFRVGFTRISYKSAAEKANYFLNVRDYDATQKKNFYDYLKATSTVGSTPLRGALSNAGRYFAKKAVSQGTYDPVQYSCQRNFSVLATDGGWNTGDETTTYGPFGLDGLSVGQRDASAARPMRDKADNAGSGGSSDSLADVAMYFYSTDLRTPALGNCTGALGVDVCENNVSSLSKDTADWQHMAVYTLSLGQNGTLKFDPTYDTQSSGDFYDLKQGTKVWPTPVADANNTTAAHVDDLWHAAINGRGIYFNAADPAAVITGLKSALSAIEQITVSGGAAATSTLRPVAGNNQVFVARYTSALWTGEVSAYKIDTATGEPLIRDSTGKDIADWRATDRLKARSTVRKIYYKAGSSRGDFSYSALAASGYASYFDNACSKTPALSQCAVLSSSDKSTANSGASLVDYLRGTAYSVYRTRNEILGDMVGSSPVFVGAPPLRYKDSGYVAYQTANANRRSVLYVGANDGMLHAFDASTGDELWAYVPTMVMANMYKLADNAYGDNHQYFVDGSPMVADVSIGGVWKTILVGGLGGGGRGYYALDVSNPDDMKPLWEFTPSGMGQSFATPLVTKSGGKWVVAMGSGYNTPDGKSRIYLRGTEAGDSATEIPSDLASGLSSDLGPLNAWVDAADDNTAARFYAGDLQGRLWRFTPGVSKGVELARFQVGGVAQPISTRPQLALVTDKGLKIPVIYVGTGKMLGLTDLTNADKQSIYGIKDDLGSTGYGDIRVGNSLVGQSLVDSNNGNTRTAGKATVDWSLKNGWYVDLPDSRERINIDMLLQFNTLVATSNVPQSVASCTSGGGYAWLYYLNIANGGNTGLNVATKLKDAMAVGVGTFLLDNGKNGAIISTTKGPLTKILPTVPTVGKVVRRASWRELIDR